MGVRPLCQRGKALGPTPNWIGKAILGPRHLGKRPRSAGFPDDARHLAALSPRGQAEVPAHRS